MTAADRGILALLEVLSQIRAGQIDASTHELRSLLDALETLATLKGAHDATR